MQRVIQIAQVVIARLKRIDIAEGRVFSPMEVEHGANVVVIGSEVAEKFFEGLNPVGRTIRIADFPYRVIGVAESQGKVFGISLDKFVIAPYTSQIKRVVNPHLVVDGIIVRAETLAGSPAFRDSLARRREGRCPPRTGLDGEVATSHGASGPSAVRSQSERYSARLRDLLAAAASRNLSFLLLRLPLMPPVPSGSVSGLRWAGSVYFISKPGTCSRGTRRPWRFSIRQIGRAHV